MPVVPPANRVLVTGANGYIASWVVRTLLEDGYIVRGTVRSEHKGVHLKKIFAEYGESFEIVVVSDIAKEGAFDEAVKGVDAIEHTASPFHLNADDPQELIEPAVKGTVGVLQSALKHGTNVRRIVFTSSCASVLEVHSQPRTFSELDWNEQSVLDVEKNGKKAAAMTKYRASKTLAERAAWKFLNDHKDVVQWDLVVINPPFVFGPVIHDVSHPSTLNTSAADFYNTVVLPFIGGKSLEQLHTGGSAWVDVRDLGLAHSLALRKDGVANERIIVSAGGWFWQEWLDAANSLEPSPIPSHPDLPKGIPGSVEGVVYHVNYDTAKADRLLGIRYRTKEELVRDTLADFERRGW